MHRLVLRRVRAAVDLAAYGEDDVEEQAAPLADGHEGVSVGEDGYETILQERSSVNCRFRNFTPR